MTLRSEMAVWLLRSVEGADYNPPNATGLIFTDVTPMTYGAAFIEELANRGITDGSPVCSGAEGPPYDTYCPNDPTSRAEMAKMLLLSTKAFGYDPPPCFTGDDRTFTDVAWDDPFCPYIEQAASEGLVSGSRSCSSVAGPPFATFCSDEPVSRASMSVNLVTAIGGLAECVNPVSPLPPTGACSLYNGTCSVMTALECLFYGEGVYEGDGVSCSDCSISSALFCDGFETSDTTGWTSTIP
jgi:hypothetical protein